MIKDKFPSEGWNNDAKVYNYEVVQNIRYIVFTFKIFLKKSQLS